MVRAGDFKNGLTVMYKDNLCQVIDFQHVKPGKGSPFVRAKLKNIKTGGVVEDSFSPDDKLRKAMIERKDMMYLYDDGDMYNFMDNETFEQVGVEHALAADAMKFVKENETVTISFHEGNAFEVTPPIQVILEVIETEPGEKGNTAQGAKKPCTVETGAMVMVPLFVNTGDMLKIDTRTGEYASRA
ncbi:MAG: elongation factor P [Lachnospiraceae bacterium]|nr:elongation factor P [Lachnospiraceae bacterium]